MKIHNYLLKLCFVLFIIYSILTGNLVREIDTAGILVLLLLVLLNEKYFPGPSMSYIQLVLTAALSYINISFAAFTGICAYDFAKNQSFWGIAASLIIVFGFVPDDKVPLYLLVMIVCTTAGYLTEKLKKKEASFSSLLDKERQNKYELEKAKAMLLASSEEMVHITEIRERNRIARQIHDNAGHSLAGVHIQLQAAARILASNPDKTEKILDTCIEAVSNALEVLRNTVHNIKPSERTGVEYIKKICGDFTYCPVEFNFFGNFDLLSSAHMEFISSCIKESLTNVIKHSRASLVKIELTINENFFRLYIKDNGKGSSKYTEGLGISGIRERVKNLGGNVTIDASEGFLIICIIPTDLRKGGRIFENINSR